MSDRMAIGSWVRAETFVRHVESHEELGSTNDRALELAADRGLPTPALVLADRQTAGRGRGANVWRSGPGALTFSLVIDRPEGLPRERTSIVSLAAGLAARDIVAAAAPGRVVKVKWPNDVYLDGRKVCGILTEVSPVAGDRVVIGVGVNANNGLSDASDEFRRRAVSLREMTGAKVDVGDLLVGFLVRLEAELAITAETGGLALDRWKPHCLLTCREIRLKTPAGESAGRCLGVTQDGALLLDGPDGPRSFHGGEVVAF